MIYEKPTKEAYKMELDDKGAPEFSQANFKLINTFLIYDSNYSSVEDENNPKYNEMYAGVLNNEKEDFFKFKRIEDYEGGEEEYKEKDSLYRVIVSIDRVNSTHLASQGPAGGNEGRIETAKGIINEENFREKLFNGEPELVDKIAKFGKGKNNFSFASKFCSYLCRYVFKGSEQENNYCIYDDVVQSVLPYYINKYNVDCEPYYITRKDGHNESRVYEIKKSGCYREYFDIVKGITDKIKEKERIEIKFEEFDHLLWYYFKGQKDKVQLLMDTLPKGIKSSRKRS